jgi:sugar lactone lactonase YvrE
MPGAEVEVYGTNLGTGAVAVLDGAESVITLARPTRMAVRLPAGKAGGHLFFRFGKVWSIGGEPIAIATPLTENLHPVANPAIAPDGTIFSTVSGSRGQQTPVPIFKIDANGRARPFVREMLNPSGLAVGPDGYLYVSSRAEGTVYRVSPEGIVYTYAEGLGIATGIAFGPDGSLYVGDRSGTIFKIGKHVSGKEAISDRETFVFAMLEPSISAYHLAFSSAGTLYVTGPTTSSNQVIHAIDADGTTTVFYRGLGRPQGLAFDGADNLYVAASLGGERGIVRITPSGEASLALAGSNLIGLAFHPDGRAILATRDALYAVAMSIG